MRIYLYGFAGILFALWFSLHFLGAAGFVAFVIGMLAAQAAFRFRPSVNVAFVAGLICFALTIAIWSVAIGPPRPSDDSNTPTPTLQT
jgi:hypothetical protein